MGSDEARGAGRDAGTAGPTEAGTAGPGRDGPRDVAETRRRADAIRASFGPVVFSDSAELIHEIRTMGGAPGSDPIRRWTVAEMGRMMEAGIIEEGGPEYLLDGVMYRHRADDPPQVRVLSNLLYWFFDRLPPDGWTLRPHHPVLLGPDSNPEPDLVVAIGPLGDYDHRQPGGADVALAIEVGDVTLDQDRGEKLRAYAAAGIPRYWVVDVPRRRVDVFERPRIEGGVGAYDLLGSFGPGADIPVALARRDGGSDELPPLAVVVVFAGLPPAA